MSTTFVEDKPTKGVRSVLWEGLTENESGAAYFVGDMDNLMVQMTGTFANETVTLEGSLDGTNFVALNDLQDGAIALTAAGMSAVQERPLWIRPSCGTGGGAGTPDVDITVSGVDLQ